MKNLFLVLSFSFSVLSFFSDILHSVRPKFLGDENFGDKFISFLRYDTAKFGKDISNLETKIPAKLLDRPRRLNGDVEVPDIKENFVNAIAGYCSVEEHLIRGCICKETFHDITILKQSGIDSVVVIAANVKLRKLVVSYRPTITLNNWITNFNYSAINLPGAPFNAKVHRGFYAYYNSTITKSHAAMVKLLEDPKYKDYPIHVTGYSLGSAIATLSAPGWSKFLYSRGEKRKLAIHALAGPRVGNQGFADYVSSFDLTLVRYSNQNDLIIHLPPRSFGFVHVGTEYFARKVDSSTSKIERCSEDYDEDPNCAIGVTEKYSFRRHLNPFDSLIKIPPVCET